MCVRVQPKQQNQSEMNLRNIGTFLAVWRLRLHTSTAGGTGLIPGLGTKIPQAAQLSKTRKEEEREKCIAQINNHGGPVWENLVSTGHGVRSFRLEPLDVNCSCYPHQDFFTSALLFASFRGLNQAHPYLVSLTKG